MKRTTLALLACALFLGVTAGCSWLCCDPCKEDCCPPPQPCSPCCP